MKIYISGKISGLIIDESKANFDKSIFDLIGKTMACRSEIINPFDIKPLFGIKKWLFFMVSDLRELRKCTHIAMQKNWTESRGAIIEYYFAKFIFKLKIIWL